MSKNKIIWILILLIVAILVFVTLFFFWINNEQQSLKSGKVCINKNCFEVQIVENFWQQNRGLMFREYLVEYSGMLFVFDKEANYPFWMKNTKISLDIIWINENKEIVYVSEFAQPCLTFFCPQINPQKNAKYVLEINGGLSKKLNIKVGDEVAIK